MAEGNSIFDSASDALTLEGIRDSLIRQEDTIVFSLIERARFLHNSRTYQENYAHFHGCSGSLIEVFVKETEAIQAKAGRYENPEENPFFPDHLPPPQVPPHNFSEVLYAPAASINVNKDIWDFYFKKLLPSFVSSGDDGNYASTAASDLACLQALSRRIHYGKFVAEVKFRDAPHDYESPIRAQDRDALMKLLTSKPVEEMVKKRVEKKAKVFGQEVTLDSSSSSSKGEGIKYKIDPSVVSHLYDKWVIPLTKEVEVEYLLCRLD